MAGSLGSLGGVSYDIVAEDKTGAGLDSARSNFVVTAGDIVNALQSVAAKLAEFDEKNAALNRNLGITALTMGMNAEELRGWANELSLISGGTDAILEMSGLLDQLAKAGLRTHDEMISTAEGFDRIADAVGRPADEITASLIPAFRSFGIPLQDVNKYSDLLSYTFNATGVSADVFGQAIKRAGPELAAAGVSMDDLAAIMLILKSRGYDGRNMMSELTTATGNQSDANKDGKVTLDEMLASMKISNGEMTTTRDRLETNSQGYAKQAQIINDTTMPVQAKYNNTIDNTVLGLGGLTTPLTTAASLFGGLAGSISSFALPIALLFPSIGTTITGALAGLPGVLAGALEGAGAALAGSLVAGIAGGIALGLAGVWVLLKTGVLDAISNLGRWIESSPIGSMIMDALKVVLAPIGSLGAGIIELVKGNFAGIIPAMIAPFTQAGEAIQRAIDRIKEIFGGLGSALLGAAGSVFAGAQAIFNAIGAAFFAMVGQVQGIFSQLMNAIKGLITGAAGGFFNLGQNIIVNLINGIVAGAAGVPGAIAEALRNAAGSIGGFFGLGGSGTTPPTSSGGEGIVAGITRALGFQEGGVVPGPIGAAVPAVVHGGERIIPVGGGSGGGDIFNIIIQGSNKSAEQLYDEFTAIRNTKRKQKGY